MVSLIPDFWTEERPRAVTAIAIVCGLLAVTSFAFFLLLLGGYIPLSAGAALLGGGLEQLGPPAFLLNAALTGLLAFGLLGHRWARLATIVYAVIGIFFAVPAISSAVVDSRIFAIVREGLQIMIRVVAIYFLNQEPVKEWFATK